MRPTDRASEQLLRAPPRSSSRPAAASASAPGGPRRSSSWPAARWSHGRSTRSPRAGVPRAVVAVPPGHGAAAEEALAGAADDFPLGLALVEGGATRSESVRNALAAAGDVEAVVVHDAARPLAPPELFSAHAGRARRAPTPRSPPRA